MTTEIVPSPEKMQCQARTKAGLPCRALAVSGTPYCNMHGPNATAIATLGGKHRADAYRLEGRMNPRLRDVVEMLQNAAREVHAGTIKPSQGQALASIATALIKALETAEFEVRLAVLEMRTKRGSDEF